MSLAPPYFGMLSTSQQSSVLALKLEGGRVLPAWVFLILLVTKVLFKNAEYCVSFSNDFVLPSALKKIILCGNLNNLLLEHLYN